MKKRPSLSKNRFINLPGKRLEGSTPTYIDFTRGIRKIKDYVGLYKVDRKSGKPKIFTGHLRKALQRLTMALKGGTGIKAKDEEETIRRIREAAGHTGIDSREKPQAGMTYSLTCMGVKPVHDTLFNIPASLSLGFLGVVLLVASSQTSPYFSPSLKEVVYDCLRPWRSVI
ncbi:MAG: hypothetical protein QXK69_02790 [Candidatus Caldarchaeum sp.]